MIAVQHQQSLLSICPIGHSFPSFEKGKIKKNVSALDLKADDVIIEIGAGHGRLRGDWLIVGLGN